MAAALSRAWGDQYKHEKKTHTKKKRTKEYVPNRPRGQNVDPGLVGAERFILRCLLIRRDFSNRLSGAERLHLRSLLMRRDFSQTKYILIYSNVIRKGLPLHRPDHRRLACVRSLRGHGG